MVVKKDALLRRAKHKKIDDRTGGWMGKCVGSCIHFLRIAYINQNSTCNSDCQLNFGLRVQIYKSLKDIYFC